MYKLIYWPKRQVLIAGTHCKRSTVKVGYNYIRSAGTPQVDVLWTTILYNWLQREANPTASSCPRMEFYGKFQDTVCSRLRQPPPPWNPRPTPQNDSAHSPLYCASGFCMVMIKCPFMFNIRAKHIKLIFLQPIYFYSRSLQRFGHWGVLVAWGIVVTGL